MRQENPTRARFGGLSSRDTAEAMAQEDVDVVKALFAAFANRDLVAATSVLGHEVEIRPGLVGGLEGTVYRGLRGNEQFWADIDATWVEFRIEPREFRDLGGQVLILGRAFARGRESGIAVDQPAGWIAEVRDGKILKFRSFSNQLAALEAAGLSE